jgi:hypothetical protein
MKNLFLKFVSFWKSHFLWCEFFLSLSITIIFIAWCEFFSGKVSMEPIIIDNRATIFGTVATIYGSLLGFVITAVSIIIGYVSNPRMDLVTHSAHYSDLWNTYIKTIQVLGFATIFSIISLIADHKNEMNWLLFYPNIFFLILSIFRISRSIQLLEKVIQIVTKPITNRSYEDKSSE